MKRRWPFIVTSLLCLPFVTALMTYLIVLPLKKPPLVIDRALLHTVFWLLTSPVGTPLLLALVSISIIASWFQKAKSKFEIVAMVLYSAVMVFYIGYVVWFHTTGQKWDL